MASSVMVSSTTAMSRAIPTQSSVAPFTGLKSTAAFPVTRKDKTDFSHLPSNGGRVQCMKVWPVEGKKKFETLSYLPHLTDEQLIKQFAYLLRSGWVPCVEFCRIGFVYREHHRSPGYYDGRYWTMWKLPMFGCTDPTQVLKEVRECENEHPDKFNRVIGFDNVRQVQCISFITYKPPGFTEFER
ncbi:Ribulose-bisphosphate carboxylase protein [Dioscorea alata]|uniref:Ribulose-bisphosphate carboxylase protein n=1 Tax=Dioscorea alata TaxID=55571 RepID=A0ACB7TQV4_DIOAL|nr:Ribulose-bisphosphate carboxylase protein [Dioscorea alata]